MIYTENFKKAMVQKMLIPGGPGVTRLSREIGVNKQTLYNWRDKFHDIGTGNTYTHRSPRQWTNKGSNLLLAHYYLLRNNYDIISYFVFSLCCMWHGVL
jgi:hypothetical protein